MDLEVSSGKNMSWTWERNPKEGDGIEIYGTYTYIECKIRSKEKT